MAERLVCALNSFAVDFHDGRAEIVGDDDADSFAGLRCYFDDDMPDRRAGVVAADELDSRGARVVFDYVGEL